MLQDRVGRAYNASCSTPDNEFIKVKLLSAPESYTILTTARVPCCRHLTVKTGCSTMPTLPAAGSISSQWAAKGWTAATAAMTGHALP